MGYIASFFVERFIDHAPADLRRSSLLHLAGLDPAQSVTPVPHDAFFASNAVNLGTDPNLLSEVRAPGGLLLDSGIVMICGAIMKSLLRAALLTGVVVFSMYGVSRLVSILLDGMPSSSLIGALMIELIVGGIAAFLITRFGLTQSKQ